MAIQTQNPATGKVIKRFDAHDDAYVDVAIVAGCKDSKRDCLLEVLRNLDMDVSLQKKVCVHGAMSKLSALIK